MADKWHRLLLRQLKRSGLPEPNKLSAEWLDLLARVNNSYKDADETRKLISHSIEVSSEEMRELHSKLEAYNDELENQVVLRTRELTKANQLFRTLSESAPVGIYKCDDKGKFLHINRCFREIFDQKEDKLLGTGWKSFVLSDDVQNLEEHDESDPSKGGNLDGEFRIHPGPGNVKWIKIHSTALTNGDDDKITGYVGTVEDITEQKEYEDKLVLAKELAEKATEAKSVFLANMSHELRTPLHGILSFAKFGINKSEDAERKKLLNYFEKIHQSGQTLLNLLNDLLDLAKLESGKMSFNFQPISMARLINSVIDEFGPLLSQKKLDLHFEKPEHDIKAYSDSERIKQVIRNLVSNAIKFSTEGGYLKILLLRCGEFFKVSVIDQGTGIPEDELQLVFEKFIQSSKTTTGAGGTGLGLAICQEIVAAHKGRIWAENNPEGGTIFSFEIPVNYDGTLVILDLNDSNSIKHYL